MDTRHFKIHFRVIYSTSLGEQLCSVRMYEELVPVLNHRPSARVEVTITDFGMTRMGLRRPFPTSILIYSWRLQDWMVISAIIMILNCSFIMSSLTSFN